MSNRSIHDVKATDMGADTVRFKAEVNFDGREVSRIHMNKMDLEKVLKVSDHCIPREFKMPILLQDIQSFTSVAEVEKLRCALHEKEHALESLTMTYAIELEKLKERNFKLEQTNALQEMQLGQLQAENSRLQHLLASKRNEVELLKKREKTLSSELTMANNKLEEKAAQSLEKLKQLQIEVTRRSNEREEALNRLIQNCWL